MGDRRPAALKHVIVRDYLREFINQRPVGSPAPSERDLVNQFGVARMTIRQAVEALVAEGLLVRVPGKGTFVAEPRGRVGELRGFTEEMKARGLNPGTRTLLARREKVGPGVAHALGITEGDAVLRWRRLRFADRVPMAIENTWLSEVLIPGFLEGGVPESLYAALATRGLRPSWAEDAITAEIVTDEDANLLEVPDGSAVLRVTRRAVRDDKIIAISRTLYRADRYTLWAQFEDR